MNEKIIVKYKGKKRKITAKKLSGIGMFLGLMFRKSSTDILLFDFIRRGKHAIHSYFVFFRFLAVWTDDKNNVLSIDVVKPFKSIIIPKTECFKLIEIPINRRHNAEIEFFVGKKRKI